MNPFTEAPRPLFLYSKGENYMVKMLYAYDRNRKIVHVDQVARGKGCNCTCIECGKDVVSRQGSIREHCFAHYAVSTCPGPSADKLLQVTRVPESKIHAAAKKILSQNDGLTVPAVIADVAPVKNSPILLIPSEKIRYENAKEEYNAGNYRSDVRISTEYGKTDVEICVEHPVDDAKLEKVRKANARMMEITLTDVVKNTDSTDSGILYKDLRELVLNDSSRRKWINHPYSNRIRNKVLQETQLSDGILRIDSNKYCPCNYDQDGNLNPRHQSCSTCKFHRIDLVSGKEFCSTFSPWINLLPAHSISAILSEKTCPYCGAPIRRRFCKNADKGSFICCADPWGKCRFRLDYDKTKAKLADAHLSMPDYLTKA